MCIRSAKFKAVMDDDKETSLISLPLTEETNVH